MLGKTRKELFEALGEGEYQWWEAIDRVGMIPDPHFLTARLCQAFRGGKLTDYLLDFPKPKPAQATEDPFITALKIQSARLEKKLKEKRED